MYPTKIKDADRAYFFEHEYFKEPFNFVHAYLHNDCRYGMHSHQFYEINIIATGQGRHYIKNSYVNTKAGDVFVIPPEVKHGFFSPDPMDIYIILIKSDFLLRYHEELNRLNGFHILFDIEPQIRCTSKKNYNLNLGYKEFDSFETEVKKMIKAEKESGFIYENALLLSFICQLCKRISGQQSVKQEKSNLMYVMEYIKNNLDQKLTLEVISDVANMSKATLNRHFLETIGLSPMSYVLKKRVEKARELIDKRQHNKTEVAQMCGFYDVSHMNKYL